MVLAPVFRSGQPLWIERNGILVPAFADDPCDTACCEAPAVETCDDFRECLSSHFDYDIGTHVLQADIEVEIGGVAAGTAGSFRPGNNCSGGTCPPWNGVYVVREGPFTISCGVAGSLTFTCPCQTALSCFIAYQVAFGASTVGGGVFDPLKGVRGQAGGSDTGCAVDQNNPVKEGMGDFVLDSAQSNTAMGTICSGGWVNIARTDGTIYCGCDWSAATFRIRFVPI